MIIFSLKLIMSTCTEFQLFSTSSPLFLRYIALKIDLLMLLMMSLRVSCLCFLPCSCTYCRRKRYHLRDLFRSIFHALS